MIPSLQSGGMERVMSELASHFVDKEEVEIHLVLYGKSRQIFYSVPGSIKIYKPKWPFNNDQRFLSTARTLSWLRRTVKSIKPDTVLSFGEYWNSFVLLALKGTGYPVYVSDRCKPDKNLGRVHERLRSLLYPKAAGIVAQTEFAKKYYLSKGLNENIRVIGNPIREIHPKNGSVTRENIVLTVGRLIDTKHHDRLISIFSQIDRNDWKLIIVGGNAIKQDGESRLKEQIQSLGLKDRVELTGTVSNVEDYYLKSKIFAFTSSSEGFPNVVGEAMAAGLPVVSYDCNAGPSEMIQNYENGYLVELFDDDEFKKRLTQLMEDDALRKRLGKNSEESINKFDKKNISEKFFNFILNDKG